MNGVLEQLNAVPGVQGSLVCAPDGRVLAQAFRAGHDPAAVTEAARVLVEGAAGLGTFTGPVRLLDLRYGEARVVLRPGKAATLMFVCAPSANLGPLTITASVAAQKLEAMLDARAAAPSATAPASPAAAPARASELHATVQRIEQVIERRKLDRAKARGEIALRAGFGLGFIDADTPDDPEQLARLRAAARDVLGEAV